MLHLGVIGQFKGITGIFATSEAFLPYPNAPGLGCVFEGCDAESHTSVPVPVLSRIWGMRDCPSKEGHKGASIKYVCQ